MRVLPVSPKPEFIVDGIMKSLAFTLMITGAGVCRFPLQKHTNSHVLQGASPTGSEGRGGSSKGGEAVKLWLEVDCADGDFWSFRASWSPFNFRWYLLFITVNCLILPSFLAICLCRDDATFDLCFLGPFSRSPLAGVVFLPLINLLGSFRTIVPVSRGKGWVSNTENLKGRYKF